MNQTHRGPRQDAVQKRRQYVRKKAKAITPAIIAGSLSVLLVGFVLKLAVQPGQMSNSQFAAFVVCVVLTVPCTFVIIFCEKKALSIPHVPPVSEQLAALPADEVLLRGSHQPAALPGELLRAAHEGTETAPEDLLRPRSDAP
jgi:hypothetical protein